MNEETEKNTGEIGLYSLENAHLSMVLEKLDAAAADLMDHLSSKQREIVKMKQYYWENLNEFDEYKYEDLANRQMIDAEIDAAAERMKKLRLYRKLQDSPYFGRIDFLYEGEEEPETYYIGIGNFSPKKSAEPLIFDWRAPVAGLYYDYDRGPACFTAPAGLISGEITRKLQYKIEGGKLLYLMENDMKIDDEILVRELSLHADAKLKSIVATIQREQNQIIRNRRDRILAVQGAAGSGKTSIALHRVAYLLYNNRKELTSRNILILSPNTIFSDYISTILPELGEENIREMSFDELAEKELAGITGFESRYAQLEYLLTKPADPAVRKRREERIMLRQSLSFLKSLDSYIASLTADIIDCRDLAFKKIYRPAESIRILFTEKFRLVPLLKRMKAVAEYIIDEEETLTGREIDVIEAGVIERKLFEMYRTTDIRSIYSGFLYSIGEDIDDVMSGLLDYEDVYPLIYLKNLLYGIDPDSDIKHLVIDEMQDYTPVQYALIRRMFRCPMTILGDRAQIMDGSPSEILSVLPEVFGNEVRTVVLDKSYRSTYEISSFAGKLIGQTDVTYFERHGEEPVITECADYPGMIRRLSESIAAGRAVYETTAIICRTAGDASAVWQALRQSGELKPSDIALQTEEDTSFHKGIVVTTFYLAKGLEFDSVHVPGVTAEAYRTGLDRQALYIACTRALHRLSLYCCGEKSPLLPPQL